MSDVPSKLSADEVGSAAPDPRDTLIAELRRRGRNSFAVIRSIAVRSARPDVSIEEYVDRLTRRIGALARAQALADVGSDGRFDLELLFSDELLAHAVRVGEEALLEGPRTLVKGRTAELLALAAHELASNSAEHGALDGGNGRVAVNWRRDGERLRIEWREAVTFEPGELSEPRFGHTLLTRVLVYELGAEVDLSLGEEGLVCVLALPLGGDIEISAD